MFAQFNPVGTGWVYLRVDAGIKFRRRLKKKGAESRSKNKDYVLPYLFRLQLYFVLLFGRTPLLPFR